jgi:uncharacterized protein (TIGR03437 family)
VALCLAAGSTLLANNVFVVPGFTGSTVVSGTVYSGTPLTQSGVFNASVDSFAAFAKTAANAADVKYYIVSRNSQASITILNSSFQPTANSPINLGQQVTAAALSPDGRRLVVVAGNLRVFNTDSDTELQFNNIDVGIRASAIAISQDSRFVFIGSTAAQAVYVLSLSNPATVTLVGRIDGEGFNLLPTDEFHFTTCPNGMVYLAAERKVFEFDPAYRNPAINANFDRASVRREFNFPPTARLGRVQCTPDGTRAVVLNRQASNGTSFYFMNLAFNGNSQIVAVTGNELGGNQVDRLFVGGNSRAYGITSATSTRRDRLMDIALPPSPLPGDQFAVPTAVIDPQFGSLGTVDVADTVLFSNEYPNAARAVINAPLSRLAASAANTIYDMNLTGTNPAKVGEIRLNFLPGVTLYAGASATSPPEPIGGVVPINAAQPIIRPGARMLMVGVKVLSSTGRPIANNAVSFLPGQGQPGIEGSTVVVSNSEGLAFVNLIAPAIPGPFGITVTPQNGPAVNFNFNAVAPDGTGGGGGETGGPSIEVISGDGQLNRESERSANSYVIRVLEAPNRPAKDVQVTWNVQDGGTRWDEGTFTDTFEKRITTTDANGLSSNVIRATSSVGFGNSYLSSNINASATVNGVLVTAKMFFTTYIAIDGGNLAPLPSTIFYAPDSVGVYTVRGKTGATLRGGIRVAFAAAAGTSLGGPIPNVGLGLVSENKDPALGPIAACSPKAVALSGTDGIATCDVKLSGKAGRGVAQIQLGGFSQQQLQIIVDPGDPANLRALSGNPQSGEPNANLSPLVVQLDDGGGTFLQGVTIDWTVISGSAVLANVSTFTDANGRSQNNVRLGLAPGPVVVQARARGGSLPIVNFNLNVLATLAALGKISGDNQTAFVNTNFGAPLVVQVNDNRGQGVSGQTVTFAIASGPGTFVQGGTSVTATSDSSGRASAQVRAGATAGGILVNVNVAGLNQTVSFSLTTQVPGPVVSNQDFFNFASNERGAVSPGGLFRLVGRGFAGDLRGCVSGRPLVGPYPTRVAGVELQFSSFLAAIIQVCNQDGQESITFQAPFELTPGVTDAILRSGNTQATISNVRVVDLQPGIIEFTDGQGRRYALAYRPDGSQVTPENPARWLEVIRVFIVGGGQTNPRALTGVPGTPNMRMLIDPIVGVNDSGARGVNFFYQVGEIGVYEIQIEIPDGTPTGSARSIGVLLPRPNGTFAFTENSPVIAIAPR